jgi:DMSO/TMAO reductase YedYZ molybdopterin-dependent catalytic subunit
VDGSATAVPTFTPAPDNLTAEQDILNYNNFFEFTMEKESVAEKARNLITSPWEVAVGGLVRNPGVYDVDDLKRQFDQEERVYRLRCVETWSMVIPWLGFPLWKLLEQVEPLPEAQYVRFETLYDPQQMPGQNSSWYEWPYVEGLRLDEARHDLTLLATGLYGKDLAPQNGAPIRLVVPWKYGFKSVKSIVKIDLVAEQPVSLVDEGFAPRIWLLRQRQPRRSPPPLVASDGAAHWRNPAAQNLALQRLRSGSGPPLRGHGLGREFLRVDPQITQIAQIFLGVMRKTYCVTRESIRITLYVVRRTA